MERGLNDLRPGIAAVRARFEDGRLRVFERRCPNLLKESGMYRGEDAKKCEKLILDRKARRERNTAEIG